MIKFPDISFYQDINETPQGVDFAKMKLATMLVVIRAGQKNWIDSDFRTNWKRAKEAGLYRGSYWFYDSRVDPKRQAELWIDAMDGDLGELPLWLDFEENYKGQFAGWRYWYDCIERLKQLTGGKKEIGIYTNYYYWLENTVQKGISDDSLAYFAKYPLWVAAYKIDKPQIPKPFADWVFWQFTSNGHGASYGVESLDIDLNYFNGDENAFRSYFKLGDAIPPVEQEPENNENESEGEAMTTKITKVTGYIKPLKSGTRLRVAPSTYTGVINSYGANDQLEISETLEYLETDPKYPSTQKGDIWGKVEKVNGVAVNKEAYMAIRYHGSAICNTFFEVVTDDEVPSPAPEVEYPDVVLVGPEGKRRSYVWDESIPLS